MTQERVIRGHVGPISKHAGMMCAPEEVLALLIWKAPLCSLRGDLLPTRSLISPPLRATLQSHRNISKALSPYLSRVTNPRLQKPEGLQSILQNVKMGDPTWGSCERR